MTEKRSVPSRIYRVMCAGPVRAFALAFVITGWALALFAAPEMSPQTETDKHFSFVLYLGSAMLIFIGCTAGAVSWLVNPAIDRRFAAHNNRGADEHKDLLEKNEYGRRHDQLIDRISELSREIARLSGQLQLAPKLEKRETQ